MPWRETTGLQSFGLFAVTGTPIFAAFFVALRYLSKRRSTGIVIEDHLLLVASVFSIVIIYPSWRWIKMWNFGIHLAEINPMSFHIDFDEYYKIQMVFNMFNNPILPLVKASILIVLLRIGGFLWPVYIAGWALFAFNALVCIIPEFFLLFQCKELSSFHWEPRTFGGAHCMGRIALGKLNLFQVTVSMLTDLLVFPIPIYLTWKLENLTLRTKLRVVLLFALSLLVTMLGGLRIWFTYQDRLQIHQPVDWTWWNIRFVVQHVENSFAIIFACLPALRTLFTGCFGLRLRSHTEIQDASFVNADLEEEPRRRSWIQRLSRANRFANQGLNEIISIDSGNRPKDVSEISMVNFSQDSRIGYSAGSSSGN